MSDKLNFMKSFLNQKVIFKPSPVIDELKNMDIEKTTKHMDDVHMWNLIYAKKLAEAGGMNDN